MNAALLQSRVPSPKKLVEEMLVRAMCFYYFSGCLAAKNEFPVFVGQ